MQEQPEPDVRCQVSKAGGVQLVVLDPGEIGHRIATGVKEILGTRERHRATH